MLALALCSNKNKGNNSSPVWKPQISTHWACCLTCLSWGWALFFSLFEMRSLGFSVVKAPAPSGEVVELGLELVLCLQCPCTSLVPPHLLCTILFYSQTHPATDGKSEAQIKQLARGPLGGQGPSRRLTQDPAHRVHPRHPPGPYEPRGCVAVQSSGLVVWTSHRVIDMRTAPPQLM